MIAIKSRDENVKPDKTKNKNKNIKLCFINEITNYNNIQIDDLLIKKKTFYVWNQNFFFKFQKADFLKV